MNYENISLLLKILSKSNNMKTAVTTASGNLGFAIIKILKAELGKENVIGIARTPQKAKHLDIEIRRGDYNNYQDFVSALKGIDSVLLVSGMDHPDMRIEQHQNVINAAIENNVKKIVYTSVIGAESGNTFSPVIQSNRKTEEDIKKSGLDWAIGRNGLYIEPDLEYIDMYVKEGGIFNCADNGKCGYTSRTELAFAYYKLLTKNPLSKNIYNLLGNAITQTELATTINDIYKTKLIYKNIPSKEYHNSRKAALGDFLVSIIGGIYDGIRTGEFEIKSDFKEVCKRPHKSVYDIINDYKNNQS